MIRVTVRSKDHGMQAMERAMRQLHGATVTVGIHASAGSQRAAIASTHEFGAPSRNIPARPWLRPVFDAHYARNQLRMRGVVQATFRGQSAAGLLALIGEGFQRDVQRYIESQPGSWAPLSERTLARRAGRSGQRRPRNSRFQGHRILMDTRQHLFNFIRYEVSHAR